MTDTNQNILLLRNLVEETIGRRLTTTTDFSILSTELKERKCGELSISTLKRMWGYVDGYQKVRENTLDVLSSYVGYANFRTFVKCFCESACFISSKIMLPKPLYAKDIIEGEEVVIKWDPNRVCRLKSLGGERFEVIDVENSKLSVGDTFSCRAFYKNQPCFLENFVHAKEKPCDFVVGNNGGLTFVECLNVV